MTSAEYQAPTWVNEDDPHFIEGVSPDLGAGYLNQLAGAVAGHGQRLGAITPVVTTLQATALDQTAGDNRYILQTNANGFAPAEATATALAGKQPLDADLTALAGLDSATAGTVASDGAGWVKKTYAQFRTALGLATIATSGKLADATDLTVSGAQVGDVLAASQLGPLVSGFVHPDLLTILPKLAPWYAALAGHAGSPANLVIVGDSIGEGQAADSWANRLPARLQDALRAHYPSGARGGFGFIPARYNYSGASATAWTAAGNTANQAHGLGMRGIQLTAAGGGSLTITRRCTSFDLHVKRLAADSITIAIDGGAPVTYTPPTSGPTCTVWSSGQLTPGEHTIVVTQTAGGPIIAGGVFYDGDETKGVRVWDGSIAGATAATFNTVNWSDWLGVAVTPHLVWVEVLTNDVPVKTAAQYKTDMAALIDLIRTRTTAPILLMPPWRPYDRTVTSPFADYLAALRDLAATKTGVVFHDIDTRVGDMTGNPYAILADSVHPNLKGVTLLRDLSLGVLLPAPRVPAYASPPEIFLSAPEGIAGLGGPNLATIGSAGLYPAWKLDAAANESVGWHLRTPLDWQTFDVLIRGANDGAGTGDVVWRLTYSKRAVGGSAVTADTSAAQVTVTSAAQNVIQEVRIASGVVADPAQDLYLRVDRRAADVADTLANDYGLSSVILRRTS